MHSGKASNKPLKSDHEKSLLETITLNRAFDKEDSSIRNLEKLPAV